MAKVGDKRHVPNRIFDTWHYKVKDVEIERMDFVEKADREDEDEKYAHSKERVRNKLVKVDVYIEKQTVHSEEPPHPLDTVSFRVRCEELNITLEGTDIEVLRAAMWSKLDKAYEIKWERFLLVEIKPHRPWEGLGEGLELCYNSVYRGTTYDGKFLMRKWRGGEEKISVWPGRFENKAGKVLACIPETEANEEALKEFGRRINELCKRLQTFLEPENIQATLANLAGLSLLPPAPAQEEEAEPALDVQATKV